MELLSPELAWIYFSDRMFGGPNTARNEAENGAFKENPNVHSKAHLVDAFRASERRAQRERIEKGIICELRTFWNKRHQMAGD